MFICPRFKYTLLRILLLQSVVGISQNTDSLLHVWNDKTQNDTTRLKAIHNLSWTYSFNGKMDSALLLAEQEVVFAKKVNSEKYIAFSYGTIGSAYQYKGNYPEALKNYFEALKILNKTGEKKESMRFLTYIGTVYYFRKNYTEALKNYYDALKIAEELGIKKAIAYEHQNIASIYEVQNDHESAMKHYSLSQKICEELGQKSGLAICYNGLASIFNKKGAFEDALKYCLMSLKIREELADKKGIKNCYITMGEICFKQKGYQKSREWFEKGLNLAKKINSKDDVKYCYESLSKLDSCLGNYQSALVNYKIYSSYKDSIFNEENERKTVQVQMQYEFDIKQAADSLKISEERKLNLLKFEQEKKQRYFLYAGLSMLLVFLGFLFNRFRVTQKQKKLIAEQKAMVDEKNKDITDSINYAQRIQSAILPPAQFINEYLPENFVLYKPKAIVAGDFYWMEIENDIILIAAADCTGHGVPGAMVSVVCSNALNRTVKEFGITDPGKILDKVRELVVETFAGKDSYNQSSDTEVKDGMDISLCSINKKNLEVKWAGANNPLWYFQNGQMNEIKANKQPIGKTDIVLPFTTNTIQLSKGNQLFLFTDGYADQFGGEKGKKFKYKQMQEVFCVHIDKPLKEQKIILNSVIEKWRGNLEQVDDILVIGIRL